MKGRPLTGRVLVERLGGAAPATLGIDLATPGGPERWFVAACVLAERAPAGRGAAAVEALAARGVLAPEELARRGPDAVRAALEAAGHPRAEPLAHRLVRACRQLGERHQGSFDTLAAGCEDLEALGQAVAALATGVGAGTVLRFLRPLRARWSAAGEVPLARDAVRAAIHLGWLGEGDEAGAATLAARLADEEDPPELAELEGALERLGRRGCRSGDPARCPLGGACPAA